MLRRITSHNKKRAIQPLLQQHELMTACPNGSHVARPAQRRWHAPLWQLRFELPKRESGIALPKQLLSGLVQEVVCCGLDERLQSVQLTRAAVVLDMLTLVEHLE